MDIRRADSKDRIRKAVSEMKFLPQLFDNNPRLGGGE